MSIRRVLASAAPRTACPHMSTHVWRWLVCSSHALLCLSGALALIDARALQVWQSVPYLQSRLFPLPAVPVACLNRALAPTAQVQQSVLELQSPLPACLAPAHALQVRQSVLDLQSRQEKLRAMQLEVLAAVFPACPRAPGDSMRLGGAAHGPHAPAELQAWSSVLGSGRCVHMVWLYLLVVWVQRLVHAR